MQTQSNFDRHWGRSFVDRKFCQYIFCNIFIGIVAQSSRYVLRGKGHNSRTFRRQKHRHIYSPTKVKHHLTCFNNIFSDNELISNRFAVFVICTHIFTYLWNRLLIDFYLCVYDRVCKVPRVLFNICVCERKLILFCVEF